MLPTYPLETYRHVPTRTRKRTSQTSLQITTHAKIDELDHACTRNEDITRLNISMDDLVGVHIVQAFEDTLGQARNYFFPDPDIGMTRLHLARDRVECTAFAQLHEDVDFGRIVAFLFASAAFILGWRADVGTVAHDQVGMDKLGEMQFAQELTRRNGPRGNSLRSRR